MNTNYTYNYYLEKENILKQLLGDLDKNIDLIEDYLEVSISVSDNNLNISGDKASVEETVRLVDTLVKIIKHEGFLTPQKLKHSIELVKIGEEGKIENLFSKPICKTASGKSIRPKTLGQYNYIKAIEENDIVFGIGPAGTGKTYLAMAMAATAFKENKVNRIILTRPAVEAGESLGFLPGDLQEKVDPYLRPLYDALFDIMGFNKYLKLMDKGLIEVAPLAYMRGRTLDSAYIILDEAQNTTNEQMKMFLTRLGHGSKAIITGDITQVDLPRGQKSGLKSVEKILKDTEGIEFVKLKKEDVVRHSIVQRIIEAYENYEEN